MAGSKLLVNLDAMIKRADFATSSNMTTTFDNVSTIGIRDITKGGVDWTKPA